MMLMDINLQIFLLIYIALVSAFIVADVVLKIMMARFPVRQEKAKKYWKDVFESCLASEDGVFPKKALRRLRWQAWILGFFDTYDEMSVKDSRIRGMIEKNKDGIFYACSKYRKSNVTLRAYFAHFCCSLKINTPEDYNKYTRLMLSCLTDHSVYSCENALKALYSFGNAQAVADAFGILSEKHIYHSEKLLADGLLTFSGDMEKLEDLLVRGFPEWSGCCRVALVNFLNYRGTARFDGGMMKYLKDPASDTNLKCSILRMLSKRGSAELAAEIERILKDDDAAEWEAAAVAAKAAGNMDSEEMREALFRSLSSKYWIVRMNSAKSLAKMNVPKEMICRKMKDGDRYAAEELRYELEAAEREGRK